MAESNSRFLTFDESMEMLKLFYDMEVEQVSYSYTPLYGWCMLLEGFSTRIFRRKAEDNGLECVREYEGMDGAGYILPASLWKRSDGKYMTDKLFGLDAENVDAEPLKLRADGRTWKRLETALSKQMVKDFDAALARGL
jgi:hypothetical protein